MYLSAAEIGDVPKGVVTVILTMPAVWVGALMMIWVPAATWFGLLDWVPGMANAGVVPNMTAVTPINPVPLMITAVPPDTGPPVGEMPVTVGVPTFVNLSAGEVVLVPVGVVTVTSTVPAALAGLDTTISEPVFTMIVPAAEPNFTEVAPVNVVPVTITSVPPAVVPYVGEIPVTVGVTGESVKV